MTPDPRLAYRDAVAAETVLELARLVPTGEPFLLIDEQFLVITPQLSDRPCRRFEQSSEPPLEGDLLRQFETFRSNGLRFVVFAWPALWWLKQYPMLADRLQATSVAVDAGDGYVVFTLGDRDLDCR